MTLDEFLDDQSRRRFIWGETDCVAFGLAWAREASGRPLAAFFDYGSRRDAERALQARGGLEVIVRDWMTRNRFPAIDEPEDGDIGLAPTSVGIVAPVAVVIRRCGWWITRELKGVGGMQFKDIPAWRVS